MSDHNADATMTQSGAIGHPPSRAGFPAARLKVRWV